MNGSIYKYFYYLIHFDQNFETLMGMGPVPSIETNGLSCVFKMFSADRKENSLLRMEIFNAASIKVTVFKIKSHFTEYSSVISSLLNILTEICIFSKFFKQMHVYKNKQKFAYLQHAFPSQLNVDTYFNVILNCF